MSRERLRKTQNVNTEERKNVKRETEEDTRMFSKKKYSCRTKGRLNRKLVAVGHTAILTAQWHTHGTSFMPFGRHVARHQVVSCADFRSQYRVSVGKYKHLSYTFVCSLES